eukprot:scaffold2156_cov115-Cylindrotheca_fusiformis.AAC.18
MSCIPERSPEEFIERSFENTAWTKFLHNRVPRFGNSNDVFDFAEGQDAKDEYIRGLVSSTIALCVLFALWMAALVYFKVRGPSYFGWLSGRWVDLPAEPTPPGVTNDKDELALMEDELITVNAIKRGRRKLGLSLGKTRQGAIVVYKIDEKSQFADSNMQVGQRLAAVNDTICPEDLKEVIKLIQDCEGPLTIKVYDEVLYEDMVVIAWDVVYDKAQRKHQLLRHVVFAALVIIISMGIVLCANGAKALSEVVNTGEETFNLIEDRIGYGIELLDEFLFSMKNIKKDGIFLLEAINESCPKRAEQICTDITDPESCHDNLGIGFVGDMQKAIEYINNEDDYEIPVKKADDELHYLTSHARALGNDVEKLTGLVWGVMFVSISLSVICVCIVAGMGFDTLSVFGCFQRYFIYPMFIILVSISFLLSIGFMIASLVVADTCYDDPGPKVAAIVENMYSGSSPVIEDVMLRVFEGCKAPPESLHAHMDFLQDNVLFFEQLTSSFDEFESEREDVCGFSGWTSSNLNLAIRNKINAPLCEASNHLGEFEDFFTCRYWYPIYYEAVHESVCNKGTDGFAVIATTQIVVVFMALIILTHRAALGGINVSEEDENSENEGVLKDLKLRRPDPLTSDTSRLSSQTSKMTDDSADSIQPSDTPPFDQTPRNTSFIFSFEGVECQTGAGTEHAAPMDSTMLSSWGPKALMTVCEEDCSSNDNSLHNALDEMETGKSVFVNENAQHSPPATPASFGMMAVAFSENEKLSDEEGLAPEKNSTDSDTERTTQEESSSSQSDECKSTEDCGDDVKHGVDALVPRDDEVDSSIRNSERTWAVLDCAPTMAHGERPTTAVEKNEGSDEQDEASFSSQNSSESSEATQFAFRETVASIMALVQASSFSSIVPSVVSANDDAGETIEVVETPLPEADSSSSIEQCVATAEGGDNVKTAPVKMMEPSCEREQENSILPSETENSAFEEATTPESDSHSFASVQESLPEATASNTVLRSNLFQDVEALPSPQDELKTEDSVQITEVPSSIDVSGDVPYDTALHEDLFVMPHMKDPENLDPAVHNEPPTAEEQPQESDSDVVWMDGSNAMTLDGSQHSTSTALFGLDIPDMLPQDFLSLDDTAAAAAAAAAGTTLGEGLVLADEQVLSYEEAFDAPRQQTYSMPELDCWTSKNNADDSSSLESFVESLEASLASIVEAIGAQDTQEDSRNLLDSSPPLSFTIHQPQLSQQEEDENDNLLPPYDEVSDSDSSKQHSLKACPSAAPTEGTTAGDISLGSFDENHDERMLSKKLAAAANNNPTTSWSNANADEATISADEPLPNMSESDIITIYEDEEDDAPDDEMASFRRAPAAV